MNQCICVDCQNKCYEYENSITSDKAYFEWAHKKDKCKVESDELSDLTTCDDAISRQAAIEAFQMFREYESNRSNKEWVDRIETVLNQLPPVNPQPKTDWIPISERLPIGDAYTGPRVWQQKVLITGYLSFDDTKELFVSEAFAKDVIFNRVPDTIVIAWMPLPKPYESKTESEDNG